MLRKKTKNKKVIFCARAPSNTSSPHNKSPPQKKYKRSQSQTLLLNQKAWQKTLSHDPPSLLLKMMLTCEQTVSIPTKDVRQSTWYTHHLHTLWTLPILQSKSLPSPTKRHSVLILYIGNTKNLNNSCLLFLPPHQQYFVVYICS